jgi:hypothetical protein
MTDKSSKMGQNERKTSNIGRFWPKISYLGGFPAFSAPCLVFLLSLKKFLAKNAKIAKGHPQCLEFLGGLGVLCERKLDIVSPVSPPRPLCGLAAWRENG